MFRAWSHGVVAPVASSCMTPSTVYILTKLTLIYEGFENAIHRTGMDGWVCAHRHELLLAHTNGEPPECADLCRNLPLTTGSY